MSNTQRPSLQKKQTARGKADRRAADDAGLSMTVDGRVYTVTQGDLSALDVAMLRRETGLSFRGLLTGLMRDGDIDLVAVFVWLARVVVEEERGLLFEQVAAEIGYDVELDIAEPDQDALSGE